jgi:hypothetical protein
MEQTFEEKVRSMSAKEIIMAMVKALTHPPIIEVNMGSYGGAIVESSKKFLGITISRKYKCFGCAATNTICEISGKVFIDRRIEGTSSRAKFISCSSSFLSYFEHAIDRLRCGNVGGYNYSAIRGEFAQITDSSDIILAPLYNEYTNEDLESYIQLANAQNENKLVAV